MDSGRTGKSIADRIDILYYRKPTRMRRWRFLLSILLPIIACGYLIWVYQADQIQVYQTRPVSNAHSAFSNDCKVCHQQQWSAINRTIALDNDIHSISNESCTQCHEVGGHPGMEKPGSCTNCHREHWGREFDMTMVSDSYCIDCHKDIQAHAGQYSDGKFANAVESWDAHPEFQVIAKQEPDPGQILFNHKFHLGELPVREGMLDRNGNPIEGKTMTLECADCHTLDDQGRYFKPIRFDDHCAKCHKDTLAVDLPIKNKDNEKIEVDRLYVPHGNTERIREFLLTSLADKKSQLAVSDKKEQSQNRVLPGHTKPLGLTDEEWNLIQSGVQSTEQDLFNREGKIIDNQMDNAQRIIFSQGSGCKHCHVGYINLDEKSKLWTVEPANIKDKWMMHASFSHKSHRPLDCNKCHNVAESEKTADVNLPGIDNCRKCHQAGSPYFTKIPDGFAATRCIDCHDYHHFPPPEMNKEHELYDQWFNREE